MNKLLLVAGLAALSTSVAAEARENRMLKCSITRARAAPGPGGPALVANVPGAMTPIDLNAVQMTDKEVRKSVVVEGLFARRTEVNTLEVIARFVNCTKQPLAVQARTSFIDNQQVPTEPTSVWKTFYLPARATGTYSERSIGGANVASYLIELRSDK